MRFLFGAAVVAASLLPAPAHAQVCGFGYSPSSAPSSGTVEIAAMNRYGEVFVARGPLEYVPGSLVRGIAPSWRSLEGSPAVELFSNVSPPRGPGGSVARHVPARIRISIHRASSAGASIRIAFVGVLSSPLERSFAATCSANQVWRGSSGPLDYLIHITPGP